MADDFVRVADADALAEGAMMWAPLGKEDVLLVRLGGQVFAVDDWCTHASAMLHEGTLDREVGTVRCPIHRGCFDVRTGQPTERPPVEPIAVYAVRVEGNDIMVSRQPAS